MDESNSQEHPLTTFSPDRWEVLLLTIMALGTFSFPLFLFFR